MSVLPPYNRNTPVANVVQLDPVTLEPVSPYFNPDALDTDGNPVPTWKGQTFTYDGSGNQSTTTVTDGQNTWVRTFVWSGGVQQSDSGWVKQ